VLSIVYNKHYPRGHSDLLVSVIDVYNKHYPRGHRDQVVSVIDCI
jgi:hypothetical protein